jgi:hypothetical protein
MSESTPPQKKLLFLPEKRTAAAGGKAAGKRTRTPGSKFNRPTEEDMAYYEETAEERDKFIKEDTVVKSAADRDPLALLSTLKTEVARETAALAFQRKLNEMMGKDITQISGRRIDALKKIADIEMEMRKIGFDQVDVYGEKFQKVFKLWVDIIRDVAQDTLPPEQIDLFFNKLQSELDGWEEKAENLVR